MRGMGLLVVVVIKGREVIVVGTPRPGGGFYFFSCRKSEVDR